MSSFINLQPGAEPDCFLLPITPDLGVGPADSRYMFGGVGLSAGVSAAEKASGRPLVWATAQYVSPMPAGDTLELRVSSRMQGRQTTQLHVVGRHRDQIVLNVIAATGARGAGESQQWVEVPAVPRPEACSPTSHWRGDDTGLHGRIEVRIARGRYSADRVGHPARDGRMTVWVRSKIPVETDAVLLALLADLAPNGVGNALGMNAGGNSLDNTIRVLGVVPTEWVLVDVQVRGVERGFAHAEVHLYSTGGQLMAIGSQSLILRIR